MKLDELEKNWNQFGKEDPFWAILTDPAKKGGKWEPGEFFDSGKKFITWLLADVDSSGIEIRWKKALDFGCGAGRLTQAMCENFEEVSGVDIAESMINLARMHNKYGDRCKYHLNKREDLSVFSDNSFDFIISFIVLQHMRPEYSKKYIREFMRVLAPGGLAVFQIPGNARPQFLPRPAEPSLIDKVLHAALLFGRKVKGYGHPVNSKPAGPVMEMHGVPKEEVLQLLYEGNGEVIKIEENNYADKEWESFSYYVRKTGKPGWAR